MLSPVTGSTLDVRHCDKDDVARAYVVDQLVRKPPNHQPPFALSRTWDDRADFGMLRDQLPGFAYCRKEVSSEPRPTFLIPSDRFPELLIGFRGGAERPDHRLRISRSTRRSTSSQGTSFTRPASMSSMRRATSAAQAASTSSSGSPSRLAISFAATSARSRVSSVKASAKIFSAALVTDCMISRPSPPNKRLKLPGACTKCLIPNMVRARSLSARRWAAGAVQREGA